MQTPGRAALAASALLVVATAGCTTPPDDLGLTGDGLHTPFPSRIHLTEEGAVDLSDGALGDVPIERVAWRRGFSPAQLFVVRLDGVDAAALPGWGPPASDPSVFFVDLDTGERVPAFAELDAHPDATIVWLDTDHSPRAIAVPDGTPTLRGWLRTTDWAPPA